MMDSISRVVAVFNATVWVLSLLRRLGAGGGEEGGTFSTAGFVFTSSRAGLGLDFFADFDFLADLDDLCRGGGPFLELELFGIRAA
jgi:hypothetical protein